MFYIAQYDILKEFSCGIDEELIARAVSRTQATADSYLCSSLLAVPLTKQNTIDQIKVLWPNRTGHFNERQ